MSVTEVVIHKLSGTKKALDACVLVERLFLRGKRVAVCFSDAGRAAMFDAYLWTFAQHSFVPHSLWSSSGDMEDAVALISGPPARPNGADALVVADRLADPATATGFAEIHDLVASGPEDEGKAESWRAAGFEVREVTGVSRGERS
ncbi:MAG: DNA polymerase III subunit chi [Acidobacteriota bacterium]